MEDVLDVGPDGPRWQPPRWLVGALVTIAAIVVAVVLVTRGGAERAATAPEPTVTATPATTAVTCEAPSSSREADWSSVAAITVGDIEPGATLTRLDSTAAEGQWSVLVHRADGALGRHGAVLTYPVDAPVDGDLVDVGDVEGRLTVGGLVWSVGDGFVRLRGDLEPDILLLIARATSIVEGRPSVQRLYGFQTSAPLPYRPPEVHEVRYTGAAVGASGAALGFVYTGVLRGAALEDQLFLGSSIPAGAVHGQPAVATSTLGGSGVVAWAPAPGVVAYVGYSGASMGTAQIQALTCLARAAAPLTEEEWQRTDPQVIDEPYAP